MPDFLSYHLREEFIDKYRGREPKWGFPISDNGDSLGAHSWLTKYSRKKSDGTRERFWEGLQRVIEGMFSIQKDYVLQNRLPWNEEMAHKSAQEAYERCFAGKWSPPGRGFWMMGTELVNGRGDSSALQNCSFISTENLREMDDPSYPFTYLMSASMLGIGVGFDTRGAGDIVLCRPHAGEYPVHVIDDSREGWVESVGVLLRSFFLGKKIVRFDYSRIRPLGSPIRGFGGTASGPAPLAKLHDKLILMLDGRPGHRITSTDIVDIMNLIGKCVVSANVRRSAEVALGDPDDEAFLALKDWRVNPERTGKDGWSHLSNNSVIGKSGGDYSHLAERMSLNGEPGIFWLDVAQNYGRLADPADGKEYRTKGGNPCMEQPLESGENCTLVETYPTNCDDLQDYLRSLKFAFMYGKTVTLLPTQWAESNAIMIRNRRIGTSMTGLAEFAEKYGWTELKKWQDAGYQEIRRRDKEYSEWLGVRESIRCTTIKPSGTVSLLYGVTPGVHWPQERGYYIRTVRDIAGSPFAEAMQAAGYPVEPSVSDPETTVVISMPVEGPDIRSERDVSVWEKANLATLSQRWWSDNAVSVTLTFRKDEAEQIPAVLRSVDGQLKSVSFLPMAEGTYEQAPYQRVTRSEWERLRGNIKPLDWDQLYSGDSPGEPEGEMFCESDACLIRESQ